MQKHRHPFQTAFWAIAMAVVLPSVVFMFGAVRHRQLQSTANPRWAEFAKVTSPQATNSPEVDDDRRLSVQSASFLSGEQEFELADDLQASESNQSKKITSRPSVEVLDQADSFISSAAVGDSPDTNHKVHGDSICSHPLIVRSVDDERDLKLAETANRIESQLDEIRHRLDQLTQQQLEHQSENSERGTQLLDAMKKFHALVENGIAEEASRNVTTSANEIGSKESPVVSEVPIEESRPEVQSDSVSASAVSPTNEQPAEADPVSSQETFARPVVIPSKAPTGLPSCLAYCEESPGNISSKDSAARTTSASGNIVLPEESIHIRREVGPDGTDLFSMDVRDADIRVFFGKLSEASQVSILPSPNVTGHISLNLHKERLSTALRAIVKSHRYVAGREGAIVIIYTAEEAARLKREYR